MTDRQHDAIRPLLAELAKFDGKVFRDEPDNANVSPGVYLTLAQWRAILREFA